MTPLWRLADGRRVHIRWLRPTDTDLLRKGFARLSLESRTTRFFAPLRELSDEAVRVLTNVDGRDHVALIALSAPDDPSGPEERGLGVARFVRSTENPTNAEVAVTIADDAQGTGLGRALLQMLAFAARERGIETFSMVVLSSNCRVRRLLRLMGAEWYGRDGDVATYRLGTKLRKRETPDFEGGGSELPRQGAGIVG